MLQRRGVVSTARAGAIEEAGAVGSHTVEAARRTLSDDDVTAERLDRQADLLDELLG